MFGRLCLYLPQDTRLPPLAGTPAGVWLYDRDWTMRLQYPNPHPPPLSMHHYIPAALPQHPLPQRFWPETRALGGSSVPRAFPFTRRPPSLSVFFDVLPLAAVSVSLCHFLTHKLTDRYTTATCLCPSCTSFPQQSGERGVSFSSGDSSVELIY